MTKAADIMAATTPGRWRQFYDDLERGTFCLIARDADGPVVASDIAGLDARAIVTAVNLFPLYEAVREAAREVLYIGAVRPFRDAAEDRLGAALDALQAAEDAL